MLELSIDLAEETRKIAREQHLNQVHYLVQLVRHALTHHPRTIRIRSAPRWIELTQDGENLHAGEWELLARLLVENAISEDGRQRALSILERRYGVAILSLLFTFPSVEITTGGKRMTSGAGRVVLGDRQPPVPGYRIRVERRRTSRKDEAGELAFFCAGSAVPVVYNGRRINAPIVLSSLIMPRDTNHPTGHGRIGIPARGDLSSYQFFKNGIRFGVKQFLSRDALPVRGFWNSTRSGFEPEFRQSIRNGESCLRAQAWDLSGSLAENFGPLPPEAKSRLKQLVLAIDPALWPSGWERLPLFHSCRREYALSLQDLAALQRRYGAVPYVVRPDPAAPAAIPRLVPEDAWFLRRLAGRELRIYRPFR